MPDTALYKSPYGELLLSRRPHRRRETLQAWDAADDYILQQLSELKLAPDCRLLIVNDAQGSLSTALSSYDCSLWADSAISQLSAIENCARNKRPSPSFIPSTRIPKGRFDYILYKLPKSRSLLRYQLQCISTLIVHPEQFIGAAMARHIDHHVVEEFSKHLATAKPSLARKKARLIQLQTPPKTINVTDDTHVIILPELNLTLSNRANVFSRDKLDRGSRLMLRGIDKLATPPSNIADLACGNGLLGLYAARKWANADIHFFDDSFMAIDSAQTNLSANAIPPPSETSRVCSFSADDCLSNYQGDNFDLILCNPPFHQDHHVGDHIAQTMFRDSVKHLAPHGRLCVVGNRHLGYHVTLKKLFGHCEVIESDAKFVVLLAQRSHPHQNG
ncbi:Ribosomal RNA large subunit methyltransferase G [Zhongshania aliphaticivorans]|uniref:Ribosomal RNA large subunit methyltransferase G n=1 Tax=Zhongshania aliphaticivorans TaxID=1470434 RepID=A0A5S9NHF3_9GAMM|nr:class I SAM-dependent methyltransferase [Zhongshania aliphaticivorans]CAA0089185.1 Ribosomal RNA large subunit methyltransferase G [Zhongshania aliphaticivorans]CAA0095866.1 Ribosomal RNA large subunit methyltransferase G [Zhongshania aliphaticivorans]